MKMGHDKNLEHYGPQIVMVAGFYLLFLCKLKTYLL